MGVISQFGVNLMISFGLLFFVVFTLLHVMKRVEEEWHYTAKWLYGVVFGLGFVFCKWFVLQLDTTPLVVDGRYTLIGVVAFYFGGIPAAIAATIISLSHYITPYPSLTFYLLNSLFFITVFLTIRFFVKQHQLKGTLLQLLGIHLLIGFGVLAIADFFHFIQPQSGVNLDRIPEMVVVQTIFFISLVTLFNRDIERRNFMAQLAQKQQALARQNEELMALYEQVRAGEQVLHEQYAELMEVKTELEKSEERYRLVLRAMKEGFWDYTPNPTKWVLSDNLLALFNYNKDENDLLAQQFMNHVFSEDREGMEQLFLEKLNSTSPEEDTFEQEVRIFPRNGSLTWVLIKGIVTKGINGKVVRITGSASNITESKVQQQKIEYYAFHDSVTGCYNFEYLQERLAQLTSSEEQYRLLVVGIKKFDRFYSVYGAQLTDRLLIKMAERVSETFALADTLAVLKQGRFAAIVEEGDYHAEVANFMASLHEISQETWQLDGLQVQIQLRAGCYRLQHGNVDVNEAIIFAETAFEMSESDNETNIIVEFADDMYEQKRYISSIEEQLKQALQRNEFYLVYQPKVCATNETCVNSYEALLRWHNPHLGHVRPDLFIPLAETNGLIDQIGQFVISEVCQFIKRYEYTHDEQIKVAINASIVELMQHDYVEQLLTNINIYEVAAEQLMIEVTETAVAKHFAVAKKQIEQLLRNGFELHLDDFGTGYSSLSQLGQLPFNVLKIDKSFVWAMEKDEKVQVLTKHIIEMAHSLQMKVVAEGVETMNQVVLLQKLNCDLLQGYYFSRPVTGQQLLNKLGTPAS